MARGAYCQDSHWQCHGAVKVLVDYVTLQHVQHVKLQYAEKPAKQHCRVHDCAAAAKVGMS